MGASWDFLKRALVPPSADWEAKQEPDCRSGSKWLGFDGKVIHVAELEPRLLNLACSLSRAPWRRRGRRKEDEDEPIQKAAVDGVGLGEIAGKDVGSEVESGGDDSEGVNHQASGGIVLDGGGGLAPGVWQDADLRAEANAFAQGLAAGWRLAVRDGCQQKTEKEAVEVANSQDEVDAWHGAIVKVFEPCVCESMLQELHLKQPQDGGQCVEGVGRKLESEGVGTSVGAKGECASTLNGKSLRKVRRWAARWRRRAEPSQGAGLWRRLHAHAERLALRRELDAEVALNSHAKELWLQHLRLARSARP